ncbi:TonB family protein [Luteibacter sp.]|uniref:TonB family protein n=1 Tax=Luteibacter sp. TaxID=1886636 RepID=UPI003F81A01A
MLTVSARAVLTACIVLAAMPTTAANRARQPFTPMTPLPYTTGFYRHNVDSTLATCRSAGVDAETYRVIFVANESGSDTSAERVLPWTGYDDEANREFAHQDALRRERAIGRLQWLATRYDEPGLIGAGCNALATHAGELALSDVFSARWPVEWQDLPVDPHDEDDRCVAKLDVRAPSYPPVAVRNREHGTVLIGVTVNDEGQVVAGEVARSSGSRAIDIATVRQSRQWQFDVSTCLRSHSRHFRMIWIPVTFALPM